MTLSEAIAVAAVAVILFRSIDRITEPLRHSRFYAYAGGASLGSVLVLFLTGRIPLSTGWIGLGALAVVISVGSFGVRVLVNLIQSRATAATSRSPQKEMD